MTPTPPSPCGSKAGTVYWRVLAAERCRASTRRATPIRRAPSASHQPRSVKVAALLSKPARREVEVPVDYLGFTIDDAFVYGYGLDVGHRLRNLPFVTSQKA